MDFKRNFKWYEADSYKLKSLVGYLNSEIKEIDRVKKQYESIESLSRKDKKQLVERLNNYGYALIKKDSFYLKEMVNALK